MVADPDPYTAFYLNINPDPGSQTNADSSQTLPSVKVEFLHENIFFMNVIGLKTIHVGTKAFLKCIRFICKFWTISLRLDPDPDPGESN
jgi:hypothetical protein